jgi:hypothetical protein
LSDDKDGVCLLGELSLGVLLGNLVVLLWLSVLTIIIATDP